MKRYVYKIESSKTDNIYIGSTNNKFRYCEHTSKYKRGCLCESSKYLFDLGIEFCSFHILEEFECETYDEQLEKEQYYLDKYKDVIINKQRAKRHPDARNLDYQRYKEKKREYQNKPVNKERFKLREKERQLIYIHCKVCDKQVKKRNMCRHIKQKVHLKNITSSHTLVEC
jgi:hypothetical protein